MNECVCVCVRACVPLWICASERCRARRRVLRNGGSDAWAATLSLHDTHLLTPAKADGWMQYLARVQHDPADDVPSAPLRAAPLSSPRAPRPCGSLPHCAAPPFLRAATVFVRGRASLKCALCLAPATSPPATCPCHQDPATCPLPRGSCHVAPYHVAPVTSPPATWPLPRGSCD